MEDRQLRRAGLDYHEYASVRRHASWSDLLRAEAPPDERLFAFTSHGSRPAFEMHFRAGDWLVFGSETAGLPPALRESFPIEQRLRLPMRAGQRSLNLSNAVAVAVYEAWRQCGFLGPDGPLA
jgi:tRNA (cytidine/uridine-2'-O-)-methyltransferase